MKKVLVCITIQENSKRLISKGAALAKELEGELHILHIRKGDTIFDAPNTSDLFEELFIYGSEMGGEVHFLCSQDIVETICIFIGNNKIKNIILGGSKPGLQKFGNIKEILQANFEDLQIIIVERE
ncbi:hypothetical protein AN640_07735 [Candidatus Epulonipiscium fishelsonii]|uniref:Uncharacterized protein n=1 Tax=Candidatus Epulonipiscium fishelsonii TaxID=77094 RepID=A0ACC8XES7_9FIRM|nr:hypothetical protein AN640_07735 [Epulopiscium sp. SCG-D08WGA-EpuloA1]